MYAFEKEFLQAEESTPSKPLDTVAVKERLRDEIKNHRRITLSNGAIISSFCCLGKKGEMYKLYSKGKEQLSEEMDIITLIKRVRHMQIILDNSLMKSDSRKFQVSHAEKNLIDLDSDPGTKHVECVEQTQHT